MSSDKGKPVKPEEKPEEKPVELDKVGKIDPKTNTLVSTKGSDVRAEDKLKEDIKIFKNEITRLEPYVKNFWLATIANYKSLHDDEGFAIKGMVDSIQRRTWWGDITDYRTFMNLPQVMIKLRKKDKIQEQSLTQYGGKGIIVPGAIAAGVAGAVKYKNAAAAAASSALIF